MSEGSKVICIFCDEDAKYNDLSVVGFNYRLYDFDCSICGKYFLSSRFYDHLNKNRPNASEKLNCVAENIKTSQEKTIPFWLLKSEKMIQGMGDSVPKFFENIATIPINHSSKWIDLLMVLAKKLTNKNPFGSICLNERELYSIKIGSLVEARGWLEHLSAMELIARREFQDLKSIDRLPSFPINITPKGWREIESANRGINSNLVFIAMSFGIENRREIQGAIERACKRTGWEAFTVDGTEFLGGISDEIIVKIKKSAFIIADFTENKAGVYYEAGFAAGLGRPIIYTVHKDHLNGDPNAGKKVHFDTQHMNHLLWESVNDLEEKLVSRINYVINKVPVDLR